MNDQKGQDDQSYAFLAVERLTELAEEEGLCGQPSGDDYYEPGLPSKESFRVRISACLERLSAELRAHSHTDRQGN